MCYWGIAYASGAYYNKPWHLHDRNELKTAFDRAFTASRKARDLEKCCSPVERALVEALGARYPRATPDELKKSDRDYANAMAEVFQKFPDDIDVAVLYAESLMNLTPWQLWDPYTGKPASEEARPYEAKAAMDHAFTKEGAYEHPGLVHLYIHLVEMTREPEIGVQAADALRQLVPASGHLCHMPAHLDVLYGDYRSAIAANAAGVWADNIYLEKTGGRTMYKFYLAHNYHSLIYAAMLAGKSQVALENVGLLEEMIPYEMLQIESPPIANWLETFHSVRPHVLIRFGRWDDIFKLEIPKDRKTYCVTTANLHYAKGVAWAATGHIEEAEKEQSLFLDAQKQVPESRYDWPNKCVDALKVAEAMLAGEIQYRRGSFSEAFEHLRKAIEFDDHLVYSEPWGWMQPTRHAYAALLLEQGHVEEAAQAYAEDLGFVKSLPRGHQHPNNIWALRGYHECLTRLGRHAEARMLEQPLSMAAHVADVKVTSSCYCRGSCSSKQQNGIGEW